MTTEFHCQICARAIKAKQGLIAHHGYQRPNRGSGWQTASCLGARHPPYEVSRDRIRYVVDKVVKPYLAMQETSYKDWLDNPPAKIDVYKRGVYFVKPEVAVTYARPEGFKPPKDEVGSYSPGSYEGQHMARRWEFQRCIRAATHDIKSLEKRYAEWKAPR